MIRSLPAATVSCPSCDSEFPVDPAKVPGEGVHVICSECQRVFRVERSELDEADPQTETAETRVDESLEGAGHLPPSEVDTARHESTPEPGEGSEEEPIHLGEGSGAPSSAVIEEEPTAEAVEERVAPDEADAEREPEEPAPEVSRENPPPTSSAPTVGEALEEQEEPADQAEERPFEDLRSLASEALAEPDQEPAQAGGDSTLSRGHDRFGQRDPHDRARRLARVLVSDIIAYYPARYHESYARGTLKTDFEEEVTKSWKEYVDQVGEDLAESTPYFDEALNEILGKGEKVF